jgi:hypothetical protein
MEGVLVTAKVVRKVRLSSSRVATASGRPARGISLLYFKMFNHAKKLPPFSLFCAKRGVNQTSLIAPGMLPAKS